MTHGEIIGIAAALGSAASWALGAILFKQVGETISPLAMTFAKGIASVVLLGIAVALLGYQQISGQDMFILVASGLVGIALGDTLFFAALRDLGPQTLIVLMTVSQVLTALLALIFLGERPAPLAWGGIGAVLCGVTVVLWSSLSGDGPPSRVRGIVLGLLSVACMAGSTIMAKQGLDETSAIQATFIRMAAGVAGVAVYGLLTAQFAGWTTPFRDPRFAGAFLRAACVVTFGGFWLSLLAIKHLEIAVANTLISTEPIFVIPLAAIFLKESTSPVAIGGTLIATAGVIMVCLA